MNNRLSNWTSNWISIRKIVHQATAWLGNRPLSDAKQSNSTSNASLKSNGIITVAAVSLILAACSADNGSTGSGGCDGSCANANSFLTASDVEQVIQQAVFEAKARNQQGTIAITDRVGNVLAVYRMAGTNSRVTITSNNNISGGLENINIIPDTMAAIAKAVTGAYLSSEGNAFTTRTASQIVQDHFNPGEFNQPGGPLFGVQFSQLPCSDFTTRFSSGATAGPKRSPLGLSADSGGLPLYKDGVAVGGVGVIVDGRYGLDLSITGSLDNDLDEIIAIAAASGFDAPTERRADRITVEGKTFRYTDATFDSLITDPANAPPLLAADGSLVPVTGYFDGTIIAGTAFGQPNSGVRPDALDYPGLDAFVLVDDTDTERFRPQDGLDAAKIGAGNILLENEVRTVLQEALKIANRARAQIRRPLGSPARVSISVVDTEGNILGIVRGRDAPIFGLDVSLQKARTAAFFSSAEAAGQLNAAPDAEYLDGDLTRLRYEPIAQYVTAAQNFLGDPNALTNGAVAFADRSGGNLSRPYYPDGIDGNPPGPFSKPAGRWSPFSTGLQLDVVYNALIHHVGFVAGVQGVNMDVGTNCTGKEGFSNGFTSVAPIPELANGLQIFPGSVPIYRGNVLVGGIGVSGDGIDQDDMISFLGLHNAGDILGTINNAPINIRADQLTPMGTRLRFVNCPQKPFLNSDEQNVCAGK